MSYTKSVCTDNADSYRATFYFGLKTPVVINVVEKEDVKKIEQLFDYCTKLGAEQERERLEKK